MGSCQLDEAKMNGSAERSKSSFMFLVDNTPIIFVKYSFPQIDLLDF